MESKLPSYSSVHTQIEIQSVLTVISTRQGPEAVITTKGKGQLRKDGNVVAVGDRHENLYRMKFKPCLQKTDNNGPEKAYIHTGESKSLKIWHERLAHQNITHVTKVLKQWGIKATLENNWFCEGCAVGKMNRKPFLSSQSQTKEPGEFVQMDLCGPMEHLLIGNSRYFMLLKDDYSHYRCLLY
ncbi:retrovirus-related pol polyprotein from transposon tnt 1-94 [Lasius niger]|uniref:Retrovirus-related pol polyprotein from transposon tnt 1-94 n=1 Tax=Lasius niger TaxID=67767 RepID=A0A0J7KPK4_LASNI|nr:retrovirus-related pol polyprotein from transposon tnt 1-94 [Lasius niger]